MLNMACAQDGLGQRNTLESVLAGGGPSRQAIARAEGGRRTPVYHVILWAVGTWDTDEMGLALGHTKNGRQAVNSEHR